ncbi:hypothetical protein GCM10022255_078450 [Dactylosporangium darangshiense]|uniref:Uncharacterized protein n=1 Tax=Dactylosporangium darangshiense TaxID=579108 RepID=A0ABP8DKH9_9ACTN
MCDTGRRRKGAVAGRPFAEAAVSLPPVMDNTARETPEMGKKIIVTTNCFRFAARRPA